jgi:putative salt-induced outer membrane protein YdiY
MAFLVGRVRAGAAIAALIVCAGAAWAEPAPGEAVLVSVKTGEAFLGTLVSADDTAVTIDHPTLGRLQMPRGQVMAVNPAPKAGEAPPPPPPPPAPAAAAPEVTPDPESFWEGWKGNAELGLTGAAGNSENFGFRGGLGLKRETSKMITSLGFSYVYGTSDGDKNTDRGELNLKNEWRIAPPWRFFVTGKVEYDQFQDWDWRTSAFAGIGYEFIKTDRTLLLGRIGIGASKEFGGSDNRIKPELDLGLDWEHKLDDRQKVFATIDYYPSLLNFPEDYRVVAKAGYEVLVDPTNGMALKLGIEDRYQSQPGTGKKKNDFLYFATLVWNF